MALKQIINNDNIIWKLQSRSDLDLFNNLVGGHLKEIKWWSKLRLNYPINLTHTHHENFISVLVVWDNSIYHVSNLNKYPMLIDLIQEIKCHEAHTI